MVISGSIAAIALSHVSNRLGQFVYFDSTLFKEAKNGSKAAQVSLVAHAVFFMSFIGWFYLALNGENYGS